MSTLSDKQKDVDHAIDRLKQVLDTGDSVCDGLSAKDAIDTVKKLVEIAYVIVGDAAVHDHEKEFLGELLLNATTITDRALSEADRK